jgi:hypothetical protein
MQNTAALAAPVNMTYSFLSDEEPTDEQLETLMREVETDVRREHAECVRMLKDKIKQDTVSAHTVQKPAGTCHVQA